MFTAVQSLGIVSRFLLLSALLVAAGEACRRIGARAGRGAGGGAGVSTFTAAAFALLTLLMAVTYATALARHDLRGAAMLDEADALRDAARLAPLLSDGDGVGIVNDLYRTLDLAIGLGASPDPVALDAAVAETATVSARMWEHLGAAVAAQPGSLPATRLTEALQRVDDAVARRTGVLRDRAPPAADAMLIATAAVAMALAGFGAAGADRHVPAAVMALLLAAVVTLALDLARPDGVDAETPPTPLLDARAALAVPATSAP